MDMSTGTEVTSRNSGGEARIVVGVDGTGCGRRALEFAMDQATRSGAILHVVSIYEIPASAGAGWAGVTDQLFENEAASVLDEALDQVKRMAPALVVKGQIDRGSPGSKLVEVSRDASLLVVGCRGRNELTSLLLGSVSEYCAHHARCPVTIVH
jgi:nucleotide-binding universal stress UspA family protein